MLGFFLKGLTIGAIIAMPFGPVGMLCLQRAILMGLRVGLSSGLGAATADAFYGAVAAFGLTFVSNFLTEHASVLQIGGGIFLVGMGLRLALAKPPSKTVEAPKRRYAGAFASIFLLTLANPMTVVAFLAIFAGFGLGHAESRPGEAASVVTGVFCGSMVWWTAIAFGGKLLRYRLLAHMRLMQRCCGLLVAAFGVWAVFFER